MDRVILPSINLRMIYVITRLLICMTGSLYGTGVYAIYCLKYPDKHVQSHYIWWQEENAKDYKKRYDACCKISFTDQVEWGDIKWNFM